MDGSTGLVFMEEKADMGRLRAKARSSFVIQRLPNAPQNAKAYLRAGLNRDESKFVHLMEDFQICCNPTISYDREHDMMQAPFYLSCTFDRATNSHVVGLTRHSEDTNTYFKFIHVSPMPTHRSQNIRVASNEHVSSSP